MEAANMDYNNSGKDIGKEKENDDGVDMLPNNIDSLISSEPRIGYITLSIIANSTQRFRTYTLMK